MSSGADDAAMNVVDSATTSLDAPAPHAPAPPAPAPPAPALEELPLLAVQLRGGSEAEQIEAATKLSRSLSVGVYC